MGRGGGYGQFCPVARAAEVVAERWTPLVLRELLCGSRRFTDLRRGVPLMSPTLLSRRLKELEQAGIVTRIDGESGREYQLTEAGEALRGVILALGDWGAQWLHQPVTEEQLDPGLLMWDIRRRINREALPERRVVVHVRFHDAPRGMKRWWLVLATEEVDLCLKDPGYEVDLNLGCDVRTLVAVWLGHTPLSAAVDRGVLTLAGPLELRRALPRWLQLSVFARPAGDGEASG